MMNRIGLISYGIYLPAGVETAEDAAVRAGLDVEQVHDLGIIRKVMPEPDDQPATMARKAALDAFSKTSEVRPDDVDVVIWIGEEYKDYIAQTASIRLQEELGCRNAFAFDLVGQGITSIVGLRAARDLMIGDPDINVVLLTGGTRNIDLVDYSNPDTHFLLPYSASGTAIILKRNSGQAELIDLAFHVDPDMADEVYVPGGGTEIPFSRDNLNSSLMFFQTPRPDRLAEYLRRDWAASIIRVIKAAAKNQRVDVLALRHLSRSDRALVLDVLGVSSDTCPSLERLGHHGSNDVILALDQAIESDLVKDGSRVVLASGGIGFAFGAAMFLWGK